MTLNTREYASIEQFEALKRLRRERKQGQLSRNIWLQPWQAKELGYNQGESDFELTPAEVEAGNVSGKIAQIPIEQPKEIKPIVPEVGGNLRNLLLRLYPEKISGALAGGIKVDQLEDFLSRDVQAQITTEPEQFFQQLASKRMPAETRALLDFLNIPADVTDQIVGVQDTEIQVNRALNTIPEFGGIDTEELTNLIETKPDEFFELIRTGGITPEKKNLLAMIGFTEAEIQTLLRTPFPVGGKPTLTFLDRLKEIKADPEQLVPYLSSGAEGVKLWKLLKAAKDLEAGKEISQEDLFLLRDFIERSEADTTWGFEVLDVVAQMLPFAGEFIVTIPIFGQAKAVGTKLSLKAAQIALRTLIRSPALKKVLTTRLAKSAGKLAVEAAGITVGGTARTIPAGVTRIPAATLNKQLQATLTGDEEPVFQSAIKAFGEQWVEVVSESTGGLFAPLAAPVKGQLVKLGLFKAFQKANPGKSVNDLRRIMEKAGYHGVLGEMLEERVSDVGHGILEPLGLSDQKFSFPSVRQLTVELAAFSVPGATAMAIETAPSIFEKLSPSVKKAISEAAEQARIAPERGAIGGQFISGERWEAMSVSERAELAKTVGLEGKLGSKAWADLTLTEKQALAKKPIPEAVTIPKAEAAQTWTEAGIQPSMLPEDVASIEVRPPAKGKITQISMDDQMKLEQAKKAAEEAPEETREAYEAQWKAEALKEVHMVDPVAQWSAEQTVARKTKQPDGSYKLTQYKRRVGLDSFIPIGQTEFPDTLTVKQARMIWPSADYSRWLQQGTKQYNKVPLDVVLDPIASELGFTGTTAVNDLVARINQVVKEKRQLKEAEQAISRAMTERPLPAMPELTPEEVAANWAITGQPKYTLKQIDALVGFFADYINEPTTVRAWELTRELRRETRAGRAENLKARAQELIVTKGINAEEAMKQAITETLAGELPTATTEYLEELTEDLRNALFAKVYHTLKEEPFEMASTVTALTNALTGKAIPREPGVRGGSAFTRLQRVFGDQPKVLKAIDKMATEKKPLKDVVEGIYHETGREPIPIDQETAEYLRGLKTTVLYEPTTFREPIPVTQFEAPIEDGAKQIPLLPRPPMDNVIRVLKEIGMLPVDIGNFLRANKASFDFSFWRQQAPLIARHPISFVQSNIEAWKALWSQKSAEATWVRITRDPLYQIYEVAAEAGGDFIRPLELKKGTAQWRGVEEFGYLTGERLIPKLTAKIPWVKLSARAFETGTNVHNWLIFKNYYNAMLKLSEQYASGKKTLKPGEAFVVEKEMVDFAKSLSNFTGRGSLGKFRATAAELSGLFFAPRLAVGRILSVADLINANPRVRMEAWKNAALFVSTLGGMVLLGAAVGWWEVEKDPRSSEYMSIRIGNMRIDPWGGYRQFLVFFTRAITQTGVSSVTGAEYKADPINLIQTFIRGKASPLASLILDFWRGKNFIGEEVDVTNKRQWAERVAPFALWDIYEAFTDAGTREGIISILPAIVGAGVQTYTGDWRENFPKLGLPKYSDNLFYGLTDPKYDTADFWTDTSSQFKGVDPATLTKAKGYPEYIRAIAEARIINEHLATLPNQTLVGLNADPVKGTTFAQYYKMWRDREAIVASGDKEKLAEFDKDERTRNANLGNFSQRQFALLNEYWLITDKKKQAEFLKEHEAEIGTNLRQDYLRTHPKENAQLAVWGQAKLLTKEAYNQFKAMIKELDIPDNALPELTLPPEGSIDNYFKYQDMDNKNSWEAQLMLAKDPDLLKFLDRQPIDTPLASLELKVKNRANFDKLDGFSDEDSPDYIADDKKRAEAVKKFKADNSAFVDDTRRIDAIEKGTAEAPTPDNLIKSHVDYGKLNDREGIGSSSAESMLFRVDNPEYDKWRQDKNVWGDAALKPVDQTKIDGWRIDVKYAKEDDTYNAVGDKEDKEFYIADDKQRAQTRADYLKQNPDYATARRQREAYQKGLTGGMVKTYTDYYSLAEKGYRRERFLMDNSELASVLGLTVPLRVPSEQYDVISEKYETKDEEYEAILKQYDRTQMAEQKQALRDYLDKNPQYANDRLRRDAYGLYVPDNLVEHYVLYKELPSGQYQKDWFMMENQDFYREVYLGILENERLDFRKTPTREVYAKYQQYQALPSRIRENYRFDNPDLEDWLILTGKVSGRVSEARRKAALTSSERLAEEVAERLRKIRELSRR